MAFLINPYFFAVTGPQGAGLISGLTAYYTFDTDFTDSTGVNNGTATQVASITGSGKINSCVYLSGKTGTVSAVDDASISFTSNLTMNCWVKYGAQPDANRYSLLVGKGATTANGYVVSYRDASGTKYIEGYIFKDALVTNYSKCLRSLVLPLNTWTMITWVVRANQTIAAEKFKVYVNGVKMTTGNTDSDQGSGAATINDNNTALRIGGSSYADYNCQQYMDEVGLWNRELTAAEITTLYNSGAGIPY